MSLFPYLYSTETLNTTNDTNKHNHQAINCSPSRAVAPVANADDSVRGRVAGRATSGPILQLPRPP